MSMDAKTLADNLNRTQAHLQHEVYLVHKLLRKLLRYGGHLPACALRGEPPDPRAVCTCGWEAVSLDAVREQERHGGGQWR